LEQTNAFPQDKLVLGRWLAVAHWVGQALCYYILTSNGQVIARTTVQPIPQEILKTKATKQQIAEFDQKIIMKFGPPEYTAEVVLHPSSPGMTDVDVDLYEVARFELWEEDAAMLEADNLPPESGYLYFSTCVRHNSEKYFFRFYTSILQYYRPIIPYYR
jgi:hypothetical protein